MWNPAPEPDVALVTITWTGSTSKLVLGSRPRTRQATRQLDNDERRTVRDVIEAILLKHDAKRWTNAS